MRRRLLIVLGSAVVLTASACGGGAAPAAPAASAPQAAAPAQPEAGAGGRATTPCELLSRAEVESALGNPIQEPRVAGQLRTARGPTPEGNCSYDNAQPGGRQLSMVRVRASQETCQAMRQGQEGPASALGPGFERVAPLEDVPGLGQSAWWLADRAIRGVTAGEVTGQLGVCALTANTALTLTVAGGQDASALKVAAIDLGRKAMARL